MIMAKYDHVLYSCTLKAKMLKRVRVDSQVAPNHALILMEWKATQAHGPTDAHLRRLPKHGRSFGFP
jgi:hypothetical protein